MIPNFIHTYVSVDCVVFGFNPDNQLNILLVKHHLNEVDRENQRRLPGSLILSDEDVDDAAQRVLTELTGIKRMFLKQFKCFANPNRVGEKEASWMEKEYNRPIDRIMTVAYLSLCKIDRKIETTKYETVDWFTVDSVPKLPFDHNLIIKESLVEIRKWIETDFSIIFELLPKKFMIRQLYQLYSSLSEKKIDIKNFHKKIASFTYIIPMDEIEKNVSHRAARYYKFDAKIYRKNYSKLIR